MTPAGYLKGQLPRTANAEIWDDRKCKLVTVPVLFHGFFQHSSPHAAILVGEASGTVAFPVAVVERADDGRVHTVRADSVTFCDGLGGEYAFPQERG